MKNYIVSKDIDLSKEFEEMTVENQKNFLKDKLNAFNSTDQREILGDVVTGISDYDLIQVIQKAFDSLSSQYQADMIDYIEDSSIA